ncbi:hypothetical protein CQA49_09275 [Helicobacter sp. MIT 00-7814]|nr:hypothetical protein CQA49_09275 [Helicobacter sp. MIT 00-7814]RDU52371.1 hypothetical protein CQA37_08550 [Helicobacter sp. MIT 99-10781]
MSLPNNNSASAQTAILRKQNSNKMEFQLRASVTLILAPCVVKKKALRKCSSAFLAFFFTTQGK